MTTKLTDEQRFAAAQERIRQHRERGRLSPEVLDAIQAAAEGGRPATSGAARATADPVPLSEAIESAMSKLIERSTDAELSPCVICGAPAFDVVCDRRRCVERLKARNWARLPKAEMLKSAAAPVEYRQRFDFAFHDGECPRPIDLKAARGPRLDVDPLAWRGKPIHVTIIGVNGCGKSWLAAEMMARAIRAADGAITSAFWVRGSELYTEERELRLGVQRPKMWRAKREDVVVVDDCGWGNDFQQLADLCESRDSARRPTIWTTHRPWAKGSGALADVAPMIYDRQKRGWVIPIERGSGR